MKHAVLADAGSFLTGVDSISRLEFFNVASIHKWFNVRN